MWLLNNYVGPITLKLLFPTELQTLKCGVQYCEIAGTFRFRHQPPPYFSSTPSIFLIYASAIWSKKGSRALSCLLISGPPLGTSLLQHHTIEVCAWHQLVGEGEVLVGCFGNTFCSINACWIEQHIPKLSWCVLGLLLFTVPVAMGPDSGVLKALPLMPDQILAEWCHFWIYCLGKWLPEGP